ncbi:hypothetical protein AB6805_30490 [Chitinophaga sp. RCC_12]|uniref:hypothetical protein n=1 Tax=Chitinophaga sp. RCC_12 TaxID=3239226 RepID=UPI0035234AA7
MSNKQLEVAKLLNSSVLQVLTSEELLGFEKAYMIASAVQELKTLLTPEYMKPIMALQGNKLGFKTDKDKDGGYPEEVVKNCLIEAVLLGVQPFGNQFNIIAGNSYITKEGFGYLLSNLNGLSYKIIPQLPRVGEKSAAVVMKIQWTYGGQSNEQDIDFPIKVNSFMGTDGVIGKATRKARAWLFYTVTGSEISDGDVRDIDAKVVSTTINNDKKTPQEIEAERIALLIENAANVTDLEKLKPYIQPSQYEIYEAKLKSLS